MTIIEINLSKLERGTHEGRVKVTRGGKTFYRKQRVGRKEEGVEEKPSKESAIVGLNKPDEETWEPNWDFLESDELNITFHDGINDMSVYDFNIDELEEILRAGDWHFPISKFFNLASSCVDAGVHTEGDEIYAMSKVLPIDRSMHIMFLEVDALKRRQGYGIKGMQDIVKTIVNNKKYDKIELTSTDDDSDKFYDAIGMKRTNPGEDARSKYEGDKKWMKRFLKSISEKQ